MKYIKYIGNILAITMLMNISSVIAIEVPENPPHEVIDKYIELDMNGARLSGKTNKDAMSLCKWAEEPGWDTAFIVKSADISNIKNINNGRKYTIDVIYDVVGIASNTIQRFEFREVVSFVIEGEEGKWIIAGPIIPPHVSIDFLIKHYESMRQSNKGLVKQLKELKRELAE